MNSEFPLNKYRGFWTVFAIIIIIIIIICVCSYNKT